MDICPDHMYIQLDIPPWYCARDFIRRLKSSSSWELSQRYPELEHRARASGLTDTFHIWCDEHSAAGRLRCYQARENPVPADRIGFSSSSKVKFRCPECGYNWERSLNNAAREGAQLNCAACQGRVSWGDNIWTKKHLELLHQFDASKNELPPESYRGKDRAAWRCRNQWIAFLCD